MKKMLQNLGKRRKRADGDGLSFTMRCCHDCRVDQFKATYAELWKWADRKDTKYLPLHTFFDLLGSHYGLALKNVNAGLAALAETGALPSKV